MLSTDTVDISDWTLLSERLSTRNYISPDGKWMMKYFPSLGEDDIAALKREQEISSYVLSLGIPTPEAGGIVAVKGGGLGSVYQNIRNKKSLARAISEDDALAVPYMRKCVEIGNLIHSKACDKTLFEPIKQRMIGKLPLATMYSDREKARIEDFLNAVPECDHCLHGDFHPGNYIISEEGIFAIDLGLFSYGSPIFDWANWYFLSHYFIYPERVFHLDRERVLKCWDISFIDSGMDEEQVSILASFYSLNYIGIMPTAMFTLENNKKLTSFFK